MPTLVKIGLEVLRNRYVITMTIDRQTWQLISLCGSGELKLKLLHEDLAPNTQNSADKDKKAQKLNFTSNKKSGIKDEGQNDKRQICANRYTSLRLREINICN